MTAAAASQPTRSALYARVALAGPVAVVVSAVVTLAMPIWVPAGVGNIDNLVLPLVLFPLVWAALFFHALLDSSLWRIACVALALAAVHGAVLAWHFTGTTAAETKP